MKSGIYKIINENSGIFYIGSSINIKERFNQGNINECCNNKRRTANGYKWKFFIEK